MNFLGNLIWLIFGGFVSGIGYILGGLIGMILGTKVLVYLLSLM